MSHPAVVASPLAMLAVLVLFAPISPVPASVANPHPAFLPSFNGNFSAMGFGPERTVPAGSTLYIQYQLEDPSFTQALAGLYVRVPAPMAVFNVSWGVLHIQLSATTVSFTSSGWTNANNTSLPYAVSNDTTFPNTGGSTDRAVLSSQTLAVTSPAPYGSVQVLLRWHWIVHNLTGQNTSGAWIPAAGEPIEPDQYAQLRSPLSQSVSPGQGVGICLSGPITRRTFSLHAIVPSPHLDFASIDGTVPATNSGLFCLTLPLPSWLAPQFIEVFVWDYQPSLTNASNVTSFLLYLIKVNVVPPTSPAPSLFGVAVVDWYAGAAAVAIVGVAGLAWTTYRRRPRPPAGGVPPRGATGPVSPGLAPPSAGSPGAPQR